MNCWMNGKFTITADPHRMDRALIAEVLAASYWKPEIFMERHDPDVYGSGGAAKTHVD